ncbi:MAG: DUF2330 domain-containing protein [Cyanobacteria bacterium P01_G01_bin.54]
MKPLRSLLSLGLALLLFLTGASAAQAFCGFYVAKADTDLYNQASQVIIARDGDRTILTMANDYQGEVADFAMVVPVPVVLEEEQVKVGDPTVLKRLDDFSAPRLVEYFDENPCAPPLPPVPQSVPAPTSGGALRLEVAEEAADLGVTVEAEFTVGEYDIVILSAEESQGLETWLRQNDYNIPTGAHELLQPYIRQELKFFVAKVNLTEFEQSESQNLRPLQMAFESPRFMLPIRLGMLNAQGDQDLIVYLLSPKGQVELTNYRTVKIPSDVDVPEFVEAEFPDFYTTMFQKSYETENKEVAFLEYTWNMAWCDPCSAPTLNPEELRKAGVFWLGGNNASGRIAPPSNNVFITRLHVRYSRVKFPEDLIFQETGNQQTFQGRYVIRHPYRGEMSCAAAAPYRVGVRDRQAQEVRNLVKLTGWKRTEVYPKVDWLVEEPNPKPWWQNVFGD